MLVNLLVYLVPDAFTWSFTTVTGDTKVMCHATTLNKQTFSYRHNEYLLTPAPV
jgi:hypothetical protein